MSIDFMRLDLTIESMITEEMLEHALYNTKLEGLGKVFKSLGDKYGINPLYLCAHALVETGHALSTVSETNKNLYSMTQINKDKSISPVVFNSYEQCIETMIKLVLKVYFKGKAKKNLQTICKNHYVSDELIVWEINNMMNKVVLQYERRQ